MNVLRDVAGGLLKMFVSDAWMTVGILAVVLVAVMVTNAGANPQVAGAILFFGSIVVLVTSVALGARRARRRLRGVA
jgi:uncharacterized membrane protein YhaH (DUF805 family)